jgi:hypothetical protein
VLENDGGEDLVIKGPAMFTLPCGLIHAEDFVRVMIVKYKTKRSRGQSVE